MENLIVSSISKKFYLEQNRPMGALERCLNIFKRDSMPLQVLDNISFSTYQSEVIGIIGSNGSGKSTLLKILAGIYAPDCGKITSKGRVILISGYGEGLIGKLTMRENIYLCASILGMSRRDITKNFDEIVAFSELETFVNSKVYQFSSGMRSRLSFSTTIHSLQFNQNDILLLDEVLGGAGDYRFQKKSVKKLDVLLKGGATVVAVSHNLSLLEANCHRIIWLDQGKIKAIDKPTHIIPNYKNFSESSH